MPYCKHVKTGYVTVETEERARNKAWTRISDDEAESWYKSVTTRFPGKSEAVTSTRMGKQKQQQDAKAKADAKDAKAKAGAKGAEGQDGPDEDLLSQLTKD